VLKSKNTFLIIVECVGDYHECGTRRIQDVDVNVSFKQTCSYYHINLMHIMILSMVILSTDVTENIPEADDKFTYREVEALTESQ